MTIIEHGFRAVPELSALASTWPRGMQYDAIAAAAESFRKRFKAEGQVLAARTIDLVTAAYPVELAFAGAAWGLNPYLGILNRLVVIRFENFAGEKKLLVWEPTIPEGSAQAPFFAKLIQRYGNFLSNKVFKTEHNTLAQALAQCGVSPDEVDYLAFDHLHVQDLRLLLGSGDKPGFFPRAKLLAQTRELDTLRKPHPMQWAWYVEGGMTGVVPDRLLEFEGSLQLGKGLALIATPGHTDGNVSLCIHTPDGVWVSSENGVAIDSWFPQHSRIPGLRKYARFYQREVILNSNTLEDSIDQYNSMVLEKALADAHPRDARFKTILPSSELSQQLRQWPVTSKFFVGGFDYGDLKSRS